MPCYESRSLDCATDECIQKFRHNSDVAEMLCSVLKYMEEKSLLEKNDGKGNYNPISILEFSKEAGHIKKEVLDWWEEHKKRDEGKEIG